MERSRASFNSSNLPPDPAENSKRPAETVEELAHRVLFSDSLDKKLHLSTLRPGDSESCAGIPEWMASFSPGFVPGRPGNLRFAKDSEPRPPFPGRPGLVNETNRGVLLHFFANHELLAAELMALALLKFPDAPVAFREGLAKTLREEQLHTRWYLHRMRECGVEFGQYPVSRYFWDAVSSMECPLDYVSRLSLTFEQANLDYSLHFGRILAEAGDEKSSAILLRIYRDEISHVGYGLKWFRRWKERGESDWSALAKQLAFPLSPSRAKGNRTVFNAEGRRAAGFDDEYIEQLSLFERSKGRTPNVFFFNPDAEQRIAAWPRPFHPNQNQIGISRDLELLCAFLARRDDVLLMRRQPTDAHLAKLKRLGLNVPEIETLDDSGRPGPSNLILRRKINRIQPWAMAPDLADHFAALGPDSSGDFARKPWTNQRSSLFSKVDQVRSLGQWMGISFPCVSTAEIESALIELKRLGFAGAILKRAFSAAGSGMVRLSTATPETLSRLPLSTKVFSEGGVLIEPAHDRLFDFSIQYQIESGKARRIGFVEQIISPAGGYRGSLCQLKFCKGFKPMLAQFLMSEALPLYADDSRLNLDLAKWAEIRDYEGPLGIDAYVFRSPAGQLCLRPICEVNPRFTMGRVAHELRRMVSPAHGLKLEMVRAGSGGVRNDSPLLDENGLISGGTVMLTENSADSSFNARITVAKTFSRPGDDDLLMATEPSAGS